MLGLVLIPVDFRLKLRFFTLSRKMKRNMPDQGHTMDVFFPAFRRVEEVLEPYLQHAREISRENEICELGVVKQSVSIYNMITH